MYTVVYSWLGLVSLSVSCITRIDSIGRVRISNDYEREFIDKRAPHNTVLLDFDSYTHLAEWFFS